MEKEACLVTFCSGHPPSWNPRDGQQTVAGPCTGTSAFIWAAQSVPLYLPDFLFIFSHSSFSSASPYSLPPLFLPAKILIISWETQMGIKGGRQVGYTDKKKVLKWTLNFAVLSKCVSVGVLNKQGKERTGFNEKANCWNLLNFVCG
jgi:hypothetical protein